MNAENKNTTEGQQNEGGRTYTQEDIIKKYCALPDNVKNIINGLILNGDQIAAAGNRSEAPKDEPKEDDSEIKRLKKSFKTASDFCLKKGLFCNFTVKEIRYLVENTDSYTSRYDAIVNVYNLGAKKAFLKAKKNTSRA